MALASEEDEDERTLAEDLEERIDEARDGDVASAEAIESAFRSS